MRFRSEWLTLFTMTAVVVGAVSFPRGESATPVAATKRVDLTAAGVDYMPIGTARAVVKARSLRGRALPDHP